MPDSARSESGARADWQACTTHAFLLDHRTSCTVFRAIVFFAMTIMARSFTTHLTSFVVHRVRFGPDSRESGPNPGTGLTQPLYCRGMRPILVAAARIDNLPKEADYRFCVKLRQRQARNLLRDARRSERVKKQVVQFHLSLLEKETCSD